MQDAFNRGEGMIKDHRADHRDDFGKYTYFKKTSQPIDMPIRVVYSHEGVAMGADTIDASSGALVRNANLISKTDTDPHIEEITEEEFYALCKAIMDNKNSLRAEM